MLDALGSCLNNKYSEGYPGQRYAPLRLLPDFCNLNVTRMWSTGRIFSLYCYNKETRGKLILCLFPRVIAYSLNINRICHVSIATAVANCLLYTCTSFRLGSSLEKYLIWCYNLEVFLQILALICHLPFPVLQREYNISKILTNPSKPSSKFMYHVIYQSVNLRCAWCVFMDSL